jgi:pyruvate carboxylase subunit B
VRQQAIGNADVIDCRPADLLQPELEKLRDEIGALARGEEDVLTYAMFPDVGREFLEQRAAGTLVPEPLDPPPIVGDSYYCAVATEFNVTLHGETYHIRITGTGHKTQDTRPFFVSVDGVPEEISVETLDEFITTPGAGLPTGNGNKQGGGLKGSKRPRATEPGHVTSSMPGVIVDVMVKVGDSVQAGDPVLITEAMKMETEIQAPIAGKVTQVHVKKGDSVNPDEALIEIE